MPAEPATTCQSGDEGVLGGSERPGWPISALPCLVFLVASWILVAVARSLMSPWAQEESFLGPVTLSALALVDLGLCSAIVLWVRLTRPAALREILGLRGAPQRMLLAGGLAGAALVVFPFSSVFLGASQDYRAIDLGVALPFFALVYAPLFEEFIYRGYLFAGLRASWGLLPAAVLTTGAFLLAHINKIDAPNGDALMLDDTVFCLVALALRLWSGSLGPPVAFHFAFNATLLAFGLSGVEHWAQQDM